ncbi:MAG TPA: hypothetical protein EYP49_13500 [Anaerolineae bacterium]|nr:hypothetical protein [Anaerolineae bacterium]
MYFRQYRSLKERYIDAADYITRSRCPYIGLSMGENDWEYPFWVLLRGSQPSYIQHVDVNNKSAVLSEDFDPCAVICINCSEDRVQRYTENLGPPRQFGPVHVFVQGLSLSSCGASISFGSAFYDMEGNSDHWWFWMRDDGQVGLKNPWKHPLKADVRFTSWSLARERTLQVVQDGELLAELIVPVESARFSLPDVTLEPGWNTLTFSSYPGAEVIDPVHKSDLRSVSIALSDVTLSRCRHAELPSAAQPLEADFGDQVKLVGYAISPENGRVTPPGRLGVTLYWQLLAEVDHDYTVFVHLTDQAGRLYAQHDGQPAAGLYPTSGWKKGEIIEDEHWIEIPADIPAGRYSLRVGMYLLLTMERLQIGGEAGQADHLVLKSVEVLPGVTGG